MHTVAVWVMINLMAHQPLPAANPYAFASLADCQHAVHALNYHQAEVTCRKLNYVDYGDYNTQSLPPAADARGQRNAAYDLNKLQSIIGAKSTRSSR